MEKRMDTIFMVPIRSRIKHAAKQAFMENAELEAVFLLLKKRKDMAATSFDLIYVLLADTIAL